MPKFVKNIDYYQTFKDFDNFVQNVKIPEKKWQFFQNFIDKKSQTYGNAVKSYHASGYAETTTSRYRAKDLYNSPLMQRLIFLYHHKTAQKRENAEISVFDKAHNDLLWALDGAKNANDYQAVRAITMDIAKLHGILIDKHQVIDPVADAQINKTKQIEAARLAEHRLLGEPVDMPEDIIEGELIEPSSIDCTTNVSNTNIEAAILS